MSEKAKNKAKQIMYCTTGTVDYKRTKDRGGGGIQSQL